MNLAYQELAQRIVGELTDLERVVERTGRAWSHVLASPVDQDI